MQLITKNDRQKRKNIVIVRNVIAATVHICETGGWANIIQFQSRHRVNRRTGIYLIWKKHGLNYTLRLA